MSELPIQGQAFGGCWRYRDERGMASLLGGLREKKDVLEHFPLLAACGEAEIAIGHLLLFLSRESKLSGSHFHCTFQSGFNK